MAEESKSCLRNIQYRRFSGEETVVVTYHDMNISRTPPQPNSCRPPLIFTIFANAYM